jgi:hypothetical protein
MQGQKNSNPPHGDDLRSDVEVELDNCCLQEELLDYIVNFMLHPALQHHQSKPNRCDGENCTPLRLQQANALLQEATSLSSLSHKTPSLCLCFTFQLKRQKQHDLHR